ncbi:MAG: hypothetical protein J1E85_09755, partial [Ruminococcus sp.]|nr:hypothetical protein [Ruminococcus sp.]
MLRCLAIDLLPSSLSLKTVPRTVFFTLAFEPRNQHACKKAASGLHLSEQTTSYNNYFLCPTVFQAVSYKTKTGSKRNLLFIYGADDGARTRYLHLGKVA